MITPWPNKQDKTNDVRRARFDENSHDDLVHIPPFRPDRKIRDISDVLGVSKKSYTNHESEEDIENGKAKVNDMGI